MTAVPPDDHSIGEKAGHIAARPVSWIVVVLVCGGFLAGGIGLITAQPWLFWTGLGLVAVGGILGWTTHAMADVTARVQKPAEAAASIDSEVATH